MIEKIKHFLVLLFVMLLTFGCSNEQPQIVPYVKVNFTVIMTLPLYSALNAINNAVKIPFEGYNGNGVIVYRNSIDEFTAYDATCPQHIETKTAINLNDRGSGGQATCPSCKTVYYFYSYGTASKGYPLQRYNVSMSGGNLIIYN